uniref:Major tail protein n=1 Tax=Streptomyces phage Scarif TaxID=3158858 RepID=A0AAU7GXL6_9CAUD
MPRLTWGETGKRLYETGIDRGVLYVGANAGVAWTGLTSVEERPSGGENKSYYLDGVKYLQASASEEFTATINAFTYPDEFGQCDGTAQIRPGLFLNQQRRIPFGLSYRTMVGSDLNPERGYKIHIVYNALAEPSQQTYSSNSDSPDPVEFSWSVYTRPPKVNGYKNTAHVVIDSRTTDPATLKAIEDILYGDSELMSRLPSIEELIDVYDSSNGLDVVENPDGTFTITGSDEDVQMLDMNIFQITADTVTPIDGDTYNISSG